MVCRCGTSGAAIAVMGPLGRWRRLSRDAKVDKRTARRELRRARRLTGMPHTRSAVCGGQVGDRSCRSDPALCDRSSLGVLPA
jgi:hypothetical protein